MTRTRRRSKSRGIVPVSRLNLRVLMKLKQWNVLFLQEQIKDIIILRQQLGAGCHLLFAIGAVGAVHCLFWVHGEAFGEVPVTEHEGWWLLPHVCRFFGSLMRKSRVLSFFEKRQKRSVYTRQFCEVVRPEL